MSNHADVMTSYSKVLSPYSQVPSLGHDRRDST